MDRSRKTSETRIRLSADDRARIERQLVGTESVSQFCYRAVMEKIIRAESRDSRARRDSLLADKAALYPVVEAILKEYETEYFRERNAFTNP